MELLQVSDTLRLKQLLNLIKTNERTILNAFGSIITVEMEELIG